LGTHLFTQKMGEWNGCAMLLMASKKAICPAGVDAKIVWFAVVCCFGRAKFHSLMGLASPYALQGNLASYKNIVKFPP
jgi:hypothetical protein